MANRKLLRDPKCLCRRESGTKHQELFRANEVSALRKTHGAAPAHGEPQVHLRHTEYCILGGVNEIAAKRKLKSVSHAPAADSGDDRLWKIADRVQKRSAFPPHGLAVVSVVELHHVGHGTAGAESLFSFAPKHDGPDPRICLGGRKRCHELSAHVGRESISFFRIGKRKYKRVFAFRAAFFDQDAIVHLLTL